MPPSKRRKTINAKTGSRSNSRAATPVAQLERRAAESPEANADGDDGGMVDSSYELNPPLVLTSAKRRGVFECDYCHSDISQVPRIRCAECPDFDLCLECFLTTDHNAAIARLKASVEARTAVDNLNNNGQYPQSHYGKKGGPPAVSSWQTGSGAINHNDTHGYRVCDSTRYPMFPSSRKVMPYRPNNAGGGIDGTGSTASTSGAEEVSPEDERNNDENDMEIDKQEEEEEEDGKDISSIGRAQALPSGGLSHDVILIPDDAKAVWTVEEDLRLLDAIITHGLGNWSDIAEAIK
jgi:Zinc finger, ZZ type/Myb-like DNA-binding domain